MTTPRRYPCFSCKRRGWLPDGDIEDGMLTGRQECPVCRGTGMLSRERLLAAIRALFGRVTPAA